MRRRPVRLRPVPAAVREGDAGVGIVEILVAMTIFGIVMAAAVPLFVSSIRSSARSAQLTTATEIASQQVERARSAATSCTVLRSHLGTSSATAEAQARDSRGIRYTVVETAPSAITCPDADGVVTYTVTVTAVTNATANPVSASLTTQIWVGKS